jgi:hypothetical protein
LVGLKDQGFRDEDRYGILVLEEFFCAKHGFSIGFLRTIIIKYPYLLNKTKKQIEEVYA